jgi:hypothetical protein
MHKLLADPALVDAVDHLRAVQPPRHPRVTAVSRLPTQTLPRFWAIAPRVCSMAHLLLWKARSR